MSKGGTLHKEVIESKQECQARAKKLETLWKHDVY